MKEYKRKKSSTDLVQELSAGQYNFEYILNPAGEQQRLDEQRKAESQIQLKKSSLPEAHTGQDARQEPTPPAEPHTAFSSSQIVAFVALAAIIASVIIYALVR